MGDSKLWSIWFVGHLLLAVVIVAALHCGVATDLASEITGVGQSFNVDCERKATSETSNTSTVTFGGECSLSYGNIFEIGTIDKDHGRCKMICGEDDTVQPTICEVTFGLF